MLLAGTLNLCEGSGSLGEGACQSLSRGVLLSLDTCVSKQGLFVWNKRGLGVFLSHSVVSVC